MLNTSFLNDLSYHYSGEPEYFVVEDPYPGTGPATNLDYDFLIEGHLYSIPSKYRWENETLKTYMNENENTLHPLNIIVDQKNSNNISFGSFNLWDEINWSPPYNAPEPFEWRLYSNRILRADQNINSNEKFKDWDDTYYLNHNDFLIEDGLNSITANHEQLATVNIDAILHYGSGTANIELKDLWYKDFNETPYGIRNRGLGAGFVSHQAPYVVNNSSANEGIFLGQNFNNPIKPYYSLRAPQQTINSTRWDCYGWSKNGSSATFEDASNIPQLLSLTKIML